MTNQLHQTHGALGALLGATAEPLEVLERCETHRRFWRPEAPRVVLLAESHVYTAFDELSHSVEEFPELPRGLPRGFVRLVYSLGYGENLLLDRPIVSPPNSGTPQFWKIFQSCITPPEATLDCASIQSSRTPSPRSRLEGKLSVLCALKQRGIWLVDASVASLYLPGQRKPAANLREQVLRSSWDGYIAM